MENNFVILRTAKLRTYGNIAASGEHTFRERPTLNADPERTHLNDNRGAQSAADLVAAVKGRVGLAERTAKDPVLCIEYLITASPEALAEKTPAERQAYFDDALRWLEAKHGAANVVCTSLQRDESTEHLAAYVVPIVERQARQRKRSVIVGKGEDGKPVRETRMFTEPGGVLLSAKAFLGGREKLTAMQTDFADKVGQKHGLRRGVERSQAVHKPNAAIAPMTAERLALRKQVKELSDEIERLTQQVGTGGDALAKMTARLAKTAEVSQANYLAEREMAGKLAEANKLAGELRKQLDEALTGLAEARGQSDQMAVKLREAGAALSAQGAALAAAENEARRLADALQEVQAREGKLLDQVQQRAAAVAAAQPSKARMEVRQEQPQPRPTAAPATVADSFGAAMEWVKSAAGKVLQVKPGGWYIGQVRHADEHHAVQAQGGGNYVIHRQVDLPQRVEVSTASVEIRYGRDGRGDRLEVKPRQSRELPPPARKPLTR